MKILVLQDHPGEGIFPTFPAGTPVTLTGPECAEFLHWYPCEINGHATYVPNSFLRDGILTCEYNPTELVQSAGDILTVNAIVNAWLHATNPQGQTGWIPAQICITT